MRIDVLVIAALAILTIANFTEARGRRRGGPRGDGGNAEGALPAGSGADEAGGLKSGKYYVTQSWSQEKDYKRVFFVHVPKSEGGKKFPVLISLHGNGGRATPPRGNGVLGRKYILINPAGYRASWNIVAEASKADDLAFIEAIIAAVSGYTNVQKDNFSIMGNSNGAALVNQIACETKEKDPPADGGDRTSAKAPPPDSR